jgi:hypothetical protein
MNRTPSHIGTLKYRCARYCPQQANNYTPEIAIFLDRMILIPS